jgi:hypothetical protein
MAVKQYSVSIKQRFLFYFYILFSATMLLSCYPEWKLGKAYIESKPQQSLLIIPTDHVIKTNLKIREIGDTSEMLPEEIDSALIKNSIFLRDISDSMMLERYINSMIDEFMKLGFTVYTQEYLDTFLFLQTPAYILNIAQIQLEEHYTEHTDQEDFGEYTYHKTIDLNAITFNSWFEFSELNEDKKATRLLFASSSISDIASGYFMQNLFTGEINYKYIISELDMDVFYRYCEIFGERYAGYTFDYLMNEYITEHWPPGKKRRYYMQYRRENKTLSPSYDDRFNLMDDQE